MVNKFFHKHNSMKHLKSALLALSLVLVSQAYAHVPFLKPNQFIVLHKRLQIESSFTEFPFQADFAMNSPCFSMINPDGTQDTLQPTAQTRVANYLEPSLEKDGTYRINAAMRKGPKYKALETPDGKLYFSDDMAKHEGKPTSMQYYSCADTYLAKGDAQYTPQPLNTGIEIIPLSSPNAMHKGEATAFKVYENGKPVENARIVVVYDSEQYTKTRIGDLYDVENTRQNNLTTQADGSFSFTPNKAGLVLLFVTIHHKIDDNLWESYNTSLSLEVHLPK